MEKMRTRNRESRSPTAGPSPEAVEGIRREMYQGRERRRGPEDEHAVTVRLARTVQELTAAYALLHRQYVLAGFQDADPSGLRFTPHFALPTSHTLVAVAGKGSEVVGTLTLVVDGALGLPMEAEYPREIAALRASRPRLAEVSGLAIRRAQDRVVAVNLIRATYAFALHVLGVSDLCIAVNPAHRGFYEKVLLFETFGQIRPYAYVKGAEAVPMRADLTTEEDRFRRVHGANAIGRIFLGKGAAGSPGTSRPDQGLEAAPGTEGIDIRALAKRLEQDAPRALSARFEMVQVCFHPPAGAQAASPAASWSERERAVVSWAYAELLGKLVSPPSKARVQTGVPQGGAARAIPFGVVASPTR